MIEKSRLQKYVRFVAIKLSTQILKDPLISGLRIDRIKDSMNHYRKLQEDEPINAAHTAALDSLFFESPYAGSTFGTEKSLKGIKKRDVENYFNSYGKGLFSTLHSV